MGESANTPQPPSTPLAMLLSSSTKGDLLILFHRNPGLIDTVEGIARRMGKKGPAILADVTEFVNDSILQKKTVGRSEVYFLNRKKDKEAQRDIANYSTNLGAKKQQ